MRPTLDDLSIRAYLHQTNASDHPSAEDIMAKQLACGDVVPGCTFVAQAKDNDDLLKQVVTHAAEVHGVTEVSPELLAKVKAAVKEIPA
jgi:predicted small metal-binding protein